MQGIAGNYKWQSNNTCPTYFALENLLSHFSFLIKNWEDETSHCINIDSSSSVCGWKIVAQGSQQRAVLMGAHQVDKENNG